MHLSTNLEPVSFPFSLDYDAQIALLGSCFSDNMSVYMAEHKISHSSNIFGTIYNPVSIGLLLQKLTNQELEKSCFHNAGIWYNWHFHSSVCDNSQNALIKHIHQLQSRFFSFLSNAHLIVITLGTSWIYELNDNKCTVANCHKMPAKLFTKRLLSIEEVSQAIEKMIIQLNSFNPQLQVIFTLSPVRHTKDTLVGNNLSKAILRLGLQPWLHSNVHYYPAYELLTDQLRDYRFYADDLIHPSSMAQNIIWQHFKKHIYSAKAVNTLDQIYAIKRNFMHRPFAIESEAYKKHIKNTFAKIDQMAVSHLFEEEKLAFQAFI